MRASLLTGCALFFLFCQAMAQTPSLQKEKALTTLMVNSRPYLLLGGETGNSTASDTAYLRSMWPRLKNMNLNTVLAPVYWELMEPEEGKFDFSHLDAMLSGARKSGLRLVLLWFGTWKNSMSCYAPAWVKKDEARFERAANGKGQRQEILSAFDPDNLEADKKAFAALMAYLKKADEKNRTVLMVQVENEIGYLTDAREHTQRANALFTQPVPAGLMQYLATNRNGLLPELKEVWEKAGNRSSGSWEEVFGKSLSTDEIFQAWQYASFANEVAKAGKRIYPLPLFVNAALNHRQVKPGEYPSAGPLPHIMDIWKAAAPDIDLFSPDFYTPRFLFYSELYTRNSNPLFIPEIQFDSSTAIKALSAFGRFRTVGFSPFAIETASPQNTASLAKAYGLLQSLQPFLYNSMATDGYLLEKKEETQVSKLGSYNLLVKHDNTLGWNRESKEAVWQPGGAIMIQLAGDEFLIGGNGIVMTAESLLPNQTAGILWAEEGWVQNGEWKPFRRLNGDQTHQGRHIRLPLGQWMMQRVKLYSFTKQN